MKDITLDIKTSVSNLISKFFAVLGFSNLFNSKIA